MVNSFGFETPSIDISGFLSNSWVYIAIIIFIGLALIVGVALFLFFTTYNRKVIVFENISGQGYQPVLKTKARIVKLGIGGEELLKTLKGSTYLSAYGKKMGKNTYWYAKGEDGYLYNIVIGDLDNKKAMLDIEPIDRDVRMLHVALDRLSHQTYNKPSFLDKYANHMFLFLFLVALILGMWVLIGKMTEATQPLATAGENAVKIQEANDRTLAKLDSLIRGLGYLGETKEIEGGG